MGSEREAEPMKPDHDAFEALMLWLWGCAVGILGTLIVTNFHDYLATH